MRSAPLTALLLLASAAVADVYAREYDPRLGRFLQSDPITFNRPNEHYGYARNNPVLFSDPTGEIIRFTRKGTGIGNQAILNGLRGVFRIGELHQDTMTQAVSFGTWNDSIRAGTYTGIRGDFIRKVFDPVNTYSIEDWVEANRSQVGGEIETAYQYLASDGRRRGLELIIGAATAAAQPAYVVNDIAYGIGLADEPKSALVHRGTQRGLQGASLGQIWAENTAIGVVYANPVTGPALGVYHTAHGFATDNYEEAGGGVIVLAGSSAPWGTRPATP